MLVYRITNRKCASDISGTGAALYPGRWNKKGTPVLYTGTNREIALLEILVHIPPMISPELDILTLEIPDDSVLTVEINDLPDNWDRYPAPSILSDIGQKWIEEGETLALKVPSSIVHTTYNIILNCSHPRFKEVKVLEQKKFHLDTRLIK